MTAICPGPDNTHPLMTRSKRGKAKKRDEDNERTDLLEKIDMANVRFFAYYKAQHIVPPEEWDQFVQYLRQHLPTTFRLTGSRQTAKSLNKLIQEVHVPSLSDVTFEDQHIPPPVQIPWYPDGLAWQFNVPKKVLRKSPEFKKFHSFLVFETEVGNISRQEAVSMIPPLFLDVEPHHLVMDMCAAPGSKTAQLLEALHAQDAGAAASIPSGFLLANDNDSKRTHLLIHQSARLPSPAFMVTNLDASNYPSIRVPSVLGGKSHLDTVSFDRILCDVPCSGDGTLRKNVGIWKSWQPMDGNGLHNLQVRILLRAMKMLKDDGRIVYSTCSLNPVENEAVITEALALNKSFELVDVSSRFQELRRRPGLTSWRPTVDRTCERTFESYEELLASSMEEHLKMKLTQGHFPPRDVEAFNLHRCLRIYPHLQDSGGFFVAVLQKVQEVEPKEDADRRKRAMDEATESKSKRLRIHDEVTPPLYPSGLGEDDQKEMVEQQLEKLSEGSLAKPTGDSSFKENPYIYLSRDDPALISCLDRLHMIPDFPAQNVFVRNPEGEVARSLYLSNDIVKSIIQHNSYERIRLTTAGTKVFSKQEGGKGIEAQFRVLGEGLPVVLPYVDPTTILEGDMTCLKILLESNYPLSTRFPESFGKVIDSQPLGSHLVLFSRESTDASSVPHDLVLPIWRSNVSLSLMIDKKAKSALSFRLFGCDITIANTIQATSSVEGVLCSK